jgi:hypothetical protein
MRAAFAFLLAMFAPVALASGGDAIARYKVAAEDVSSEKSHINTVVPAYVSSGRDEPVETLHCPIPRSDRVKNFTGIQCVWSSIETLGRWAGEERLTTPPLTSRAQCKSYSGPDKSATVMKSLGVRFSQTYGDKRKGVEMIKAAMEQGRGALFDVPGHAMVLVHFDEVGDRVCWIDNSDETLKVQKSTVAAFMKRWGSWVLVIYAEQDILQYKAYGRFMPVVEAEPPFLRLEGNFVPLPN